MTRSSTSALKLRLAPWDCQLVSARTRARAKEATCSRCDPSHVLALHHEVGQKAQGEWLRKKKKKKSLFTPRVCREARRTTRFSDQIAQPPNTQYRRCTEKYHTAVSTAHLVSFTYTDFDNWSISVQTVSRASQIAAQQIGNKKKGWDGTSGKKNSGCVLLWAQFCSCESLLFRQRGPPQDSCLRQRDIEG